jgi:hypothetical protein
MTSVTFDISVVALFGSQNFAELTGKNFLKFDILTNILAIRTTTKNNSKFSPFAQFSFQHVT